MRKIHIVFLAIALCLVSLSCGKPESREAVESAAETGSLAPDFVLKDLSGRNVSLSSYRGKTVLLEFWATWCPPCQASVPELIALHNKYQKSGFEIIGISIDSGADTASTVSDFAASNNIPYTVLIADDAVSKAYNVASIPVSFLISRDGKIIDSYMGYTDDFVEKISSRIEKLL